MIEQSHLYNLYLKKNRNSSHSTNLKKNDKCEIYCKIKMKKIKRKRRETSAFKMLRINMPFALFHIFLLLLVGTAGGVSRTFQQGGTKRSCAGLPDKLDFDHKITLTSTTNSGKLTKNEENEGKHENVGDFWIYKPSEATLSLDLSAILYLDDTKCLNENQTVSYFEIDLISVNAQKGFRLKSY